MARRTFLPFALLAVLAAGAARASDAAAPPQARGTAAAQPAPVFAISGRGWGHGVGLSQWGAYGFARRGTPFTQILAHYYPGTTLGKAPLARVRVQLVAGRKSLRLGAAAPFEVVDGLGTVHELTQRQVAFGPGLRIKVGDALPAGQPRPLTGPLTFRPTTAPLELDGKPYRGRLDVVVEKGKLRAINTLGLEQYLWGVVPDEVPHDWPTEALRAQAVVARSYALAVRRTGDFDLYDDIRSQVYNGISAEEPETTAAVTATAGQVLLYAGRVATTYFFSTSGGKTAGVADVWGGDVPYLVSVPDPYDGASPHHVWGPVPFTAAQLGKALGLKDGALLDARTTLNASGRVAEVLGAGPLGEVRASGAEMRKRLGLRSTWFRIGVLQLARPEKPAPYGTTVGLTGIARGLPGVELEQRAGFEWQRVAPVRPGLDGRFTLPVKALVPGEYRVAGPTLQSAPIRLAVTPAVRLARLSDGTGVRGTVKPALPGATVAIQRLEGSAWKLAAQGPLGPAGAAFTVPLELSPGTYRARIAPGRGYSPGLSGILVVR